MSEIYRGQNIVYQERVTNIVAIFNNVTVSPWSKGNATQWKTVLLDIICTICLCFIGYLHNLHRIFTTNIKAALAYSWMVGGGYLRGGKGADGRMGDKRIIPDKIRDALRYEVEIYHFFYDSEGCQDMTNYDVWQ